jgi:hypothetical protein
MEIANHVIVSPRNEGIQFVEENNTWRRSTSTGKDLSHSAFTLTNVLQKKSSVYFGKTGKKKKELSHLVEKLGALDADKVCP